MDELEAKKMWKYLVDTCPGYDMKTISITFIDYFSQLSWGELHALNKHVFNNNAGWNSKEQLLDHLRKNAIDATLKSA
jgi:hypothetical protein